MAALHARSFLITGATDGIGRHTALKLANEGAAVLVHGRCAASCASRSLHHRASKGGNAFTASPTAAARSKDRVAKAVTYINDQCGSKLARGTVCDLASLQSARAWAQQLRDQGQPLHTLINNAGVYEERFRCGLPCPPSVQHLRWMA